MANLPFPKRFIRMPDGNILQYTGAYKSRPRLFELILGAVHYLYEQMYSFELTEEERNGRTIATVARGMPWIPQRKEDGTKVKITSYDFLRGDAVGSSSPTPQRC